MLPRIGCSFTGLPLAPTSSCPLASHTFAQSRAPDEPMHLASAWLTVLQSLAQGASALRNHTLWLPVFYANYLMRVAGPGSEPFLLIFPWDSA